MAMNYAGEFTPEITADYLKRLQQPIIEQGAVSVGRARGEALRRGMAGDPFEALRVGAAEAGTQRALADTGANLAFNVAGMQQQERYGKEQLASQQQFSAAEAEKSRQFEAQQAQITRDYQAALQRAQRHAERRAFWPNLIGGMVSTGAGVYAGKKLG